MDLALLIAQVCVLLAAARLAGLALRRTGQPQVIGEMLAGIILGPSLLGWVAPALSAAPFPPASLGFLSALSQVGLLLVRFLVGLEVDPRLLRGRGTKAVLATQGLLTAVLVLTLASARRQSGWGSTRCSALS